MTGDGAFSNTDLLLELMKEWLDVQKNQDGVKNAKPNQLVADLNGTHCCLIICTKNTCDWLIIQGTLVTGTVLATT